MCCRSQIEVFCELSADENIWKQEAQARGNSSVIMSFIIFPLHLILLMRLNEGGRAEQDT
jgi:hypothetical protein